MNKYWACVLALAKCLNHKSFLKTYGANIAHMFYYMKKRTSLRSMYMKKLVQLRDHYLVVWQRLHIVAKYFS